VRYFTTNQRLHTVVNLRSVIYTDKHNLELTSSPKSGVPVNPILTELGSDSRKLAKKLPFGL
jgi:hypothetical protein